MVKSIIIMRHAEREDRAAEAEGKDWISTAPRPQDPLLSTKGIKQAISVGEQLKENGITKILCSPMIRTVMTADIIADQLGFGDNSVCVETGLVEEAKSFRGKTAAEPRPNWNPLVLPISELTRFSSKIDTSYAPYINVQHVRDEEVPNTVRELHPTITERDEITRGRVRELLHRIISDENLCDDVVLCVGHGATVSGFLKAFEKELADSEKIVGEKSVSCFAEFRPVDENNIYGPWKSVTGHWSSGNTPNGEAGAEDVADRG